MRPKKHQNIETFAGQKIGAVLKIIAIFCVPYLLSTQAAQSGLLGPSNFDECVLKNLKGVTSDEATRLIARACANKFPKTVPADFNDRFGDRGTVSGHVYERGGLSNPIRMEGARVRLLGSAAVVPALKDHSLALEKFYEQAIAERLKQELNDLFAYHETEREIQLSEIEGLESKLVSLTNEREQLEVDRFAASEQANKALKAGKAKLEEYKIKAEEANAADQSKLGELHDRLKSIEAALTEKQKEFADAQAKADKELAAQKDELRQAYARKKIATQALRGELKKTRSQIEQEAIAKLTEARERSQKLETDIIQATQDLDVALKAKAHQLRKDYVKENIRVRNYLTHTYETYHCFDINNSGNLAIRSLTLGMRFLGKPTEELGLNIKDIARPDSSFELYNLHSEGYPSAEMFSASVTPRTTNKYKESVHGIGPSQTWPRPGENDGCVSFPEYNIRGDVQRAFERVGGFKKNSGWVFYLKHMDLARADTLRSERSYLNDKIWTYPQQGILEVFKDELDAAKPKMEPYLRLKRLKEKRPTAAEAIGKRTREKSDKLKLFDEENAPLLAQVQAEERSAKKKIGDLKRKVVGRETIIPLAQQKTALVDEIAKLEHRGVLRPKIINERTNSLEEAKETWQSVVALAVNELEVKDQEIESLKNAIAAIYQEMEDTSSAIDSLEKRSGDTYQTAVEWARDEVMENSGKDKAWLDQLLQILDGAEGTDSRVDLNGAYDFGNVPFGEYIVYVNHDYRHTKLLWLAPVEVKGESKLELGPFNSIVDPYDHLGNVLDSLGTLGTGK